MWHRYAEFLRENGRRPDYDHSKERSLCVWYKNSQLKAQNGQLDKTQNESMRKLSDGGDTYQFYVSSRSRSLPKLAFFGRKGNVFGKMVGDGRMSFDEACQYYTRFCRRMERHPWMKVREEVELAKWYLKTKDSFFNNRLNDQESDVFDKLMQNTADYRNYNGIRHVTELPEGRINEDEKNDVISVDKDHKDKKRRRPSKNLEEHAIQLYDYQVDMKKRIEKAFLQYSSVMVQMPTGTGKTHVIASVVSDFVRDGMGQVWVVAHRRELVDQIRNTLALYLSEKEMKHTRATSIQWLAKHYKEMGEVPGMLVIDEAHHAVAKTYAAVMNAYPEAKKLGVTATPYRLSGAGFGDLFEVLLTSWSIKTFIQKKYLCPFDYYCITKNSVEMFKVDGLKKRGIDGDYQPKELDESFNQNAIISRLFEYYQKLAKGKRGFVYAISIGHAENIAKYYREHGVAAVAVSSETPDAERAKDIEDFKNGKITVLCSVDLFSEGFDAPDAEFIQLARPTLSLAKYLQMVGRGLRTAKGKKACIILDNVGLKDKFGLPSRERNWNYYFTGGWKTHRRTKEPDDENMGLVEKVLGSFIGPVDDNDMVLEMSHDDLVGRKKGRNGYRVVRTRDNRQGIVDEDGKEVLPLEYDHVSVSEDNVASVRWGDTTMWLDLQNGLWYEYMPEVGYVGSVPIAYVKDTFYPRMRSLWLSTQNGIGKREMLWQFGAGLDWNGLFINWTGKPRVYKVVDTHDSGARLLRDENGKRYVQKNPKAKPVSVNYIKDVGLWFKKREEEFDDFVQRAKAFPVVRVDADIDKLENENQRIWIDAGGIITVTQYNGKQYWIDSKTHRKFNKRPTKTQMRGRANLLYIGDFVFLRNSPGRDYPYEDWQIKSDRNKIYVEKAKY